MCVSVCKLIGLNKNKKKKTNKQRQKQLNAKQCVLLGSSTVTTWIERGKDENNRKQQLQAASEKVEGLNKFYEFIQQMRSFKET